MNEDDYQSQARAFLNASLPANPDVVEGRKQSNDGIVRLNVITYEFAHRGDVPRRRDQNLLQVAIS
jgi:hypothetical protein